MKREPLLRALHASLTSPMSVSEVSGLLVDLGVASALQDYLQRSAAGDTDFQSAADDLRAFAKASFPPARSSVPAGHPGVARAFERAEYAMAFIWPAAGVDAPQHPEVHDPDAVDRWCAVAQRVLRVEQALAQGHPRLPIVDGVTDPRVKLPAARVREEFPGLPVSRYAHAVTEVARLRRSSEMLRRGQEQQLCARVAEGYLVGTVTVEDMVAHLPSAAFLAFFTAFRRDASTDERVNYALANVATALLQFARSSSGYRASVIARAFPVPEVLRAMPVPALVALARVNVQVMAAASRVMVHLGVAPGVGLDRVSPQARAAVAAFDECRGAWMMIDQVCVQIEQETETGTESRLDVRELALAGDRA